MHVSSGLTSVNHQLLNSTIRHTNKRCINDYSEKLSEARKAIRTENSSKLDCIYNSIKAKLDFSNVIKILSSFILTACECGSELMLIHILQKENITNDIEASIDCLKKKYIESQDPKYLTLIEYLIISCYTNNQFLSESLITWAFSNNLIEFAAFVICFCNKQPYLTELVRHSIENNDDKKLDLYLQIPPQTNEFIQIQNNLRQVMLDRLTGTQKSDLTLEEAKQAFINFIKKSPWIDYRLYNYHHNPLEHAVEMNSAFIVKHLLEKGASTEGQLILSETVSLSSSSNMSESSFSDISLDYISNPLGIAVKMGHEEIVDILLSYNANPDKTDLKDIKPLQFSIDEKNLSLFNKLIKKTTISYTDKYGNSMLHYAAENCGQKFIIPLLPCGINKINKEGNTPLHMAAKHGNYSAFRCLIKHNALLTIKNKHNKTAEEIIDKAINPLLSYIKCKKLLNRKSRKQNSRIE